MDPMNLLSFMLAAVLLIFAPGPDIMYLLARSLSGGTRQGVTLAAGLASGSVFHTALVAAGVAAFIQQNPTALHTLMYVGAAYLLYLAWRTLREGPASIALPDAESAGPSGALYRRGLLMNAMNPKVLLFSIAFFPTFIDPRGALPASVQILILGAAFASLSLLCFSFVAVCAGHIRDKILSWKRFPLVMNRVEAGLLSLIAAAILLMDL